MPGLDKLVRGCQVELAHVGSGNSQQFFFLGFIKLDDEVADTEVHQSLPFQNIAVKKRRISEMKLLLFAIF